MRALNICRLLSLAIFLNHGEASDAVELDGKEVKDERELQFVPHYDWLYWDNYDYTNTAEPTPRPTFKPTPYPSPRPTPLPTHKPTYRPTHYPSPRPTPHPTHKPTPRPSKRPTGPPIPQPTRKPTPNPTPDPTPMPTLHPTPQPTGHPTMEPSPTPSERPTPIPTAFPTPRPSRRPTPLPTLNPTGNPSGDEPSEFPTETSEPSEVPTETEEPSENPTESTSDFGRCDGTNLSSIYQIVCAEINVNTLGILCEEVNARGLEFELNNCDRQLTLFAPSNAAFETFFDKYDDDFFENEENFETYSNSDIILSRSDGERKLQLKNFKNIFMTDVLLYNVANGVFQSQSLACNGDVTMSSGSGTTETKCNTGQDVVGQRGTCNNRLSRFRQTDVKAANGVIHLITEVLVPSPTTASGGCLPPLV